MLPKFLRQLILASVGASTLMIALFAYYDNFKRSHRAEIIRYEEKLIKADSLNSNLLDEIEKLNFVINELQVGNSILSEDIDDLRAQEPDGPNLNKYDSLERKIDDLQKKFDAIQENIDPKGAEVLTIARLKDVVSDLKEGRADFERRVLDNNIRYEQSVDSRLQSSRDSVQWLFVVLIPLLLNFFYTVWKDFREANQKQSGE